MSTPMRLAALALAGALLAACSGGGGSDDDPTAPRVPGDPEPSPGEEGPEEPTDPDFEYYEPPAARGTLPDIDVADRAFESTHHSGSAICAGCHNDDDMLVPDESGEMRHVGLDDAWRTTVMANSARDPYWHAVMGYELDLYPSLDEQINDKCTVCHAPMAHDYAKKEGLQLRLFDKVDEFDNILAEGIYGGEAGDTLFDHAMDGVSCGLCHQIADDGNLGQLDSYTGGYVIRDARLPDPNTGEINRPAYGQYTDPEASYMLAQTSHVDANGLETGFLAQYGAHISTSETCATCHELNVDPVDDGGSPLGGDHFAEQASYTEWRLSDYAVGGPLEQSCQDCHMPVLDSPVILANGSAVKPREGFAEHTFLGANTVMQSMFQRFADELGLPNEDDYDLVAEFDEAIGRNRAFLETAASISLGNVGRAALPPGSAVDEEGEPLEGAGPMEELSFDVAIDNTTGHRLPSGYHSRRVYLHVVVTDEDGDLVFESGRIEEDGQIRGVDEDVNPERWEPHHEIITKSSQVQVYQAIVGKDDGARSHSLLGGDRYLKDNRLLPKGFSKAEAIDNPTLVENFGTFGSALTDDDFDAGGDTVTYKVPVPASGSYRVLAELRYQPLAFGHLQELFLEGDRIDAVDAFRTIYDTIWKEGGRLDEVIATASGDF